MKSVGNLTDFVRSHMLEPFDVAPRIDALLGHFDDLARAHEAVLKAKRQAAMLTPLVEDCDRHATLSAESEQLRVCREALRPYFATLKLELLDKRIANLDEEWERHHAHVKRLDERRATQRGEESELRRQIAENGGDRIERLAEAIRVQHAEQEKRLEKSRRYTALLHEVGHAAPDAEPGFLVLQQCFTTLTSEANVREAELDNALAEDGVGLRQGKQEHDSLIAEIRSLKARRSNIPNEQVMMRAALCHALGIAEDDMQFAGELLQVREDERDWEGAGSGCCETSACLCWYPTNCTRP